MAKKVILMKLLQELRGYDHILNRRPAQPTPLIYLMQLRQRNANAQLRPSRSQQRVAITAQWQNASDAPSPIKIKHTVAGECESPVVIV